ncbi:beta-glucoside-specific PTS transporter subunit IIABC [Aerococcus sp. HMSC10H05]|uniref:beta-glucoside-specific PTS transporter subunit IIABC n=1 Tax=Aerococcus sp. HMSC10H05 TaxID=1581084 RepID=UPI0008A4EF4C|nr:beta-glucoside-specific PTS transporter subunit IIABC [Aerococcus sp. HMSC10H05]OFU51393.1 PTS beta-glucoside transporter subunit EIIBCA [Aerococcus sp. HMSC10H05]
MAIKDYKALANDIVKNVGGEENVNGLRHCVTRLRFNLKDESKADTDTIKQLDGVVTVMKASGQYQVVIGNEVSNVYEAIVASTNLGGDESNGQDEPEKDDRKLVDKAIDFISGVFQPFLMPLAATGMIKGIVAILGTMGLNAGNSGLYLLLQAAGDAFFQYLPVMVAVTTARKLKMNVFTALAIAVAFLHPALSASMQNDVLYTLFEGTPFASDIYSTVFGLPLILPSNGYFSAIIPIILAVWLGARLEKWFKKRIPSTVNSFLTPFFTIMIAVPIALMVVGPIATWAASLIGVFFTWLQGVSPLVFGALLAASWQLLVIFGLHWGIIPISYLLLAETGLNPLGPLMQISTFGVLGVLIAMLVKGKEKKLKDIAIPGTISTLFGVTEPVIYGIMIPLRKPFVYAIIANIFAGAYAGATATTAYRTGGLGIFSLMNMIDNEGNLGANFWNVVISYAIAVAIGFILQMVFPVNRLAEELPNETLTSDPLKGETASTEGAVSDAEMAVSAKEEIIASPLVGDILPLSAVADEVFASGALGKGVAIQPSEGKVLAPANGTVSVLFKTGHAVGITTDTGVELLIHIGLDTVNLDGRGYTIHVEEGQKVSAGDLLVEFEIGTINETGYDTITPVIVTNTDNFTDVLTTTAPAVAENDYLFTIVK